MIIRSILAAAAAMCLFAGTANAAPFYVKAEVGITPQTEVEGFNLSDDATYGLLAGTAVGPVRVEAGVSRLSADIADFVEGDAIDYRATAYLDMPITEQTGVFVGAGVDYLQAEVNVGPFFSEDLEGTGYHYTAGIAHRISENAIGEVAYRHIEADLDGLDVATDAVTLGLRFRL